MQRKKIRILDEYGGKASLYLFRVHVTYSAVVIAKNIEEAKELLAHDAEYNNFAYDTVHREITKIESVDNVPKEWLQNIPFGERYNDDDLSIVELFLGEKRSSGEST